MTICGHNYIVENYQTPDQIVIKTVWSNISEMVVRPYPTSIRPDPKSVFCPTFAFDGRYYELADDRLTFSLTFELFCERSEKDY